MAAPAPEAETAANTADPRAPNRSFFSRTRTLRKEPREDDSNDSSKGPVGLTNLYTPAGGDAVVDLVFVHGLNGGSFSTWTHGDSPSRFWPKLWLPKDDAFKDVRIHTFGYSSGIGKESILNIPDFSRSLLSAIHDTPAIPLEKQVPIILVGHSMGGLIKKACILAHQIDEFEALSRRVSAIFFLGTPHQGADLAQTLGRLLSLAGSRPFVDDLTPQSPVIQAMNEDFPRLSDNLKIFSFFETRPCNYVLGRGLIVEKHSAVLNYKNERRTHLDVNHRDIARYVSTDDPSYVAVRNALATVIEGKRRRKDELRKQMTIQERKALCTFLGVDDAPEDDLMVLESLRFPSSCEWITRKASFIEWLDALCSKVFWLLGRPGVGKSVISSHVITNCKGLGYDCCYFFFTKANKNKDNINSFLRSMAYQMAMIHPEILAKIIEISSDPVWKEATVDKVDHSPVWRKIFLTGILKTRLSRPQYWVIDAIEECSAVDDLLDLLSRAQELWPLCIFITSRNAFGVFHSHGSLKMDVIAEAVSEEDSNTDIAIFLQSSLDRIYSSAEIKKELIRQILDKSMGCFLWVNLVQKALSQAHTAISVTDLLAKTPSDMDALYKSILAQMEESRANRSLVQAILSWTSCAFRPLVTGELEAAIQIDIKDEVIDIERFIGGSCGNLVFIDTFDKVRFVHLTVRELLTRATLESEFRIDVSKCHQRLALVCLAQLTANRSKAPRSPQAKRSSFLSSTQLDSSSFVKYASEHLFQHLANISSRDYDDDMFRALSMFLRSAKVLQWIEYIATHSSMQTVYQAGETIKTLVAKRTQRSPPLPIHKEISTLERWSQDLVHLVTKFGRRIRNSPPSIHQLVPPFCPPKSAMRQQFCSPYGGITVQGLFTEDWDDCLSTFTYPKPTRPSRIAVSTRYVALGMSTGKVFIYEDATFQEQYVIDHGEPVWCLQFGSLRNTLASGGAKTIKIWNADSWTQVCSLPIPSRCLALSFTDEDSALYAAFNNNTLMCWDLVDGELRNEAMDWTWGLDEEMNEISSRQPALAEFCSHLHLLAVVYRQEDILLWDVENERIENIYHKETGARIRFGSQADASGGSSTQRPLSVANIYSLIFSSDIDSALLAVAYNDSDLVLFDLDQGDVVAKLTGVHAQILSSSPDGRTLATADHKGGIRLFDFSTLKFLYHIQFGGNAPGSRSLAFTADSLRLVELRGRQCRVWGPSVLLRQDIDDEVSDSVSISTAPLEVDYETTEQAAITAIFCVWSSAIVFCGKEDGSVHVYDMTRDYQSQELLVHKSRSAILFLHFDNHTGLLSCSDALGCVTSRKVGKSGRTKWDVSDLLMDTRSGTAISQIMASGIHSRLLISTKGDDALWAFEKQKSDGRLVGSVPANSQSTKSTWWAAYPTNTGHLLSLQGSSIKIYLWSTLECIAGHTIEGVAPFIIDRIIPCKQQDLMITMAVDGQDVRGKESQPRRSVQVWNIRDIDPDSVVIRPIRTLDAIDIRLEHIIGVFQNRLVFVDDDYWICSVSIDSISSPTTPRGRQVMLSPPTSSSTLSVQPETAENGVIRHFFLPHDWIGLEVKLTTDLNRDGDVLFVKRTELAVIKRGLSAPSSSPSNPRRATSPSIRVPVRPPVRPLPNTNSA